MPSRTLTLGNDESASDFDEFLFVPDEDGVYKFYTFGTVTNDNQTQFRHRINIYDAEMNEWINNYCEGDSEYSLEARLEANRKYRIYTYFNDPYDESLNTSGTYNLGLVKLNKPTTAKFANGDIEYTELTNPVGYRDYIFLSFVLCCHLF